MIDTYCESAVQFEELLSLDSWLQERIAEDCFYAAQALSNSTHKTFKEIEADYWMELLFALLPLLMTALVIEVVGS